MDGPGREYFDPGDKLVVEGHRDLENHQKINAVKVMTDAGDFSL